MERRRSRGQRAGLTRDRVLAEAWSVVTDGGLEALTMRALAERLGVHPNALYSHVESKAALTDALLDDVLAGVLAPDASSGDPKHGLLDVMGSTFDTLLDHASLVPHFLARQGARGPNAQHLGEVMLELLGAAGLTGERAREARRVLIVYTIGFAAFATHPPLETRQGPTPSQAELARNFRNGLEWLLVGVTG